MERLISIVFPIKTHTEILPHSLIMSKHNEFRYLHLRSHILQQVLLTENMLNTLEEKSEE